MPANDHVTGKGPELVERYVAAVRRRLPPKEADDIAAELRGAVMARLEEKEDELGRPADKPEVAAILKSFGSPMLVATRYTGRSYLIGPDLYPYFWPTQRIVVGLVAALAIVGFLVQGVLSDEPMRHVLRGLSAAWNGALFSFGVVTVVFIVMEHTKAGVKFEASWRPELLPPETTDKPKSLFESLFSLSFDALFISWWVGFLKLPNTMPGSTDGMHLDLTRAWDVAHTPILVLAIAVALVHLADVFRPTWSRARSLVMAASNIGLLSVIWVLYQARPLLAVTGPADAADKIARLNATLNLVADLSLFIAALATAIGLVVEFWRLTRSLRAPVSQTLAM